ncbi:helix-turn-helix protein [compost metagenome]
MAVEMNMSVSGYSKIERGEIDLTVLKLQKIALILNVSVSDILNFDTIGVFGDSNNGCVRSQSANYENASSNTQKYIVMLEAEIERLKGLLA